MNYQQGLTTLEASLPATDAEAVRDVSLYKAQLLDNLRDEERFGDTETLRADRSRMIDKLNALALRVVDRSFTDLCLAELGLWQAGRVPARSYKIVGQALYDALDSDGRAALDAVRNDGIVRRQPTSYVLRFPADAVQLAALPWEALTSEGRPLLLARGSNVDSCERYIQSDLALPPPLAPDQQIHILALRRWPHWNDIQNQRTAPHTAHP